MGENSYRSTGYRHSGEWDQSYAPLSLPALFEQTAKQRPRSSFIDFYGRKYSYADVARSIERFACGLQQLGIARGDRIGLFLPNVPQYVVAYYGTLRIGAIVVNFSPLYTVEELEHQVRDSGIRAMVTLDAAALFPQALRVMEETGLEHLIFGTIASALPTAKSVLYRLFKRSEVMHHPDDPRIVSFPSLLANEGGCAMPDIDPEKDIALIQYTGGTTGMPKGAMLTHQNLTANARQIVSVDPHRADGDDRILGVLPLFHVFANTVVLNRTIALGGEIVMLPRFDAGQVLTAIGRTRPTGLAGVPTMFQALLDHPSIGQTDFHSVRACITGGAPMALELKHRFEAATGIRIMEGYGLTESSGVVSFNPYEGLNKEGTVGQPIPATQIRLVSRDDPARPAPPTEPGEVTVSGPQIMRGYWNRPEEDEKVFINGWLRTGDIGLMDEDGYLKIVDRLKDMIVVGGFKVFPSQVEAVLYRSPAIKEALVIGIPDPYHGEMPKAFVTLRDGSDMTAQALQDWANAHLGKHERLVALEVRQNLPKTLVGKLSRKELVAEERAKAGKS